MFSAIAHNKVPTTCCTINTKDSSGCHRVVTRLHLVITWQCPVSEMIHCLSTGCQLVVTRFTWLLQGPIGCYKVVLLSFCMGCDKIHIIYRRRRSNKKERLFPLAVVEQ